MDKKQKEPKYEIQQNVSAPTSFGQSLMRPLTPFSSETVQDKWIHQEYRQRLTIQEAHRREAEYATLVTGFLHIHSSSVFKQAVSQIVEMRDDPSLSDEVSFYMDQYSKRAIESLGTRNLALLDIATTNLAHTMYRDHFPPQDLEERNRKRGLLFWR